MTDHLSLLSNRMNEQNNILVNFIGRDMHRYEQDRQHSIVLKVQ